MKTARTAFVAVLILVALTAGCSPVVSVHHVLPGPLPLPEDVVMLRAEQFTVRSADGSKADEHAAFLTAALNKRLGEGGWGGSASRQLAEIPAETVATVTGQVDLAWQDAAGQRLMRRRGAAGGQAGAVSVPTLVRTASVRVDFVVQRHGGAGLGTLEVRRTYSSAADPAVRGELGLERADDPVRVPSVDSITEALLADCADSFVRMVQRLLVSAEIKLRAVPGAAARAGMDAAGGGDFAGAVGHFTDAVQAAPDNAEAHFDLAAVAEGAGQLALAIKHYQAAAEKAPSAEPDAEAAESLARVRRVAAARKVLKP
jgi:hypothetical protein